MNSTNVVHVPPASDAAPATTIERLRRAVEAHGPRAVIRAVGLSEAAFWRAYAGAKVRAGTVHQINAALEAFEPRT